MNKLMKINTMCLLFATALLAVMISSQARAQGLTKWVQVGSLHEWYSEKGSEMEEGNVLEQQYGLRWPALVNRTDGQAAKGLWIGVTNFTDASGVAWNPKVIDVGPRWKGDNEFFPQGFDTYARFDPPRVFVDGNPSFANPEDIKAVDPTLKSDRLIVNTVTTNIGITMVRKIYAFSQQYHDNYHIMEYTFTNTGNPSIGLTAKTLTGVVFFWQFRYAPGGPGPGYEVNNSQRWGINSMNDARGFPADLANAGVPAAENDVRCMYTWLGLHTTANKPAAGTSPNAATFDNIGTPIFNTSISGVSTYIQAADTNWRLGSAQFDGNGPLWADKSATDHTNDLTQPSTTCFVASDEPITQNNANTQFNQATMANEYARMTIGHAPRQAWLVQPDGKFDQQTVEGNIGDGAPGGWSHGMGYGPYTLAPGQSVRIVWAEGVSGLTYDECVRIGKQYKDGVINTKAKNDSVLNNGRTRLQETIRRAVANFNSGYNIPQPPFPPATFNVRGGGDRIALTWDPNPTESANGFAGYKIYRATGRSDSIYHLIYQCGGTQPSDPSVKYSSSKTYLFDDVTAIRGVSYYYYITSFGNPISADAATRTPAGSLESNLFYTLTYDPATLKRPAGTSSDQIRIAPNPFVISSNENSLRFPGEPDKIAFFNIPGNCVISIYTEIGELIKRIVHNDGTGDAYWNSITSANQVIVSGIYIVVIENKDTGEKTIKKLVVVR